MYIVKCTCHFHCTLHLCVCSFESLSLTFLLLPGVRWRQKWVNGVPALNGGLGQHRSTGSRKKSKKKRPAGAVPMFGGGGLFGEDEEEEEEEPAPVEQKKPKAKKVKY